MKKIFTIAVAIVSVFVVSGACGSETITKTTATETEISTPLVVERVNNEDSVVKAKCESTSSDLFDLWDEYGDTWADVDVDGSSSSRAVLRTGIKAGRQLIEASRTWIVACSDILPSDAAYLETTIDGIEPLLDDLEDAL